MPSKRPTKINSCSSTRADALIDIDRHQTGYASLCLCLLPNLFNFFISSQSISIYTIFGILLVHKLLVVPIAFNEKKQKINSWTKMENTKSNTLMTFLVEKFAKLRTCWWFWIAKSKKKQSRSGQSFPFSGRKVEKCKKSKKTKSKKKKTKSRKAEKSKNRKKRKDRKVEKFPGQEIYVRKVEKIENLKIQKAEKSKSRKVEHFLIFREKFHLKSRKNQKFKKSKSRKAEKWNTFWFLANKFYLKSRKNRKVKKSKPVWLFGLSPKVSPEKSKKSKSRKVKKSKPVWLFGFLRKVVQFSRCAITGERSG
jgi:hypothetical protein